ncbi:MAG: hypothetical protein KDJ16_03225 [Hyphomicrobiales bacterium]|nr:hypothetical protein [Hyphomicrobiales bacterium]
MSALAISAIWPTHRQIALISGALAAPFGLLDSLFVMDYWNPPHIFGAIFSIEGVLFSFGNGVFVWLLAIFPFRHRIVSAVEFKTVLRRFVTITAIALTVMLSLWKLSLGLTDLSLMTTTIIGLCVVGFLMLSLRPSILPLACTGAVGFGVFYAAQLAALSLLSPDFASVWKATVRDGATIFRYPVEEMAWAIAYGFVWTTGVAYECNVRIKSDANG